MGHFPVPNSRGNEGNSPIPLHARHSAREIRRFVRLGPSQKANTLDRGCSSKPTPVARHRCMGMDVTMMTNGCKGRKTDVHIGFGNLCRTAIRCKCDLLRDDVHRNLHHHQGVVMSMKDKSAVFILHENLTARDQSRYKNFAFTSSGCSGFLDGDGQLICSKCESSSINLRSYCIRAYLRTEGSEKQTTRNDVLLSSPSLTEPKLIRTAALLKSER